MPKTEKRHGNGIMDKILKINLSVSPGASCGNGHCSSLVTPERELKSNILKIYFVTNKLYHNVDQLACYIIS